MNLFASVPQWLVLILAALLIAAAIQDALRLKISNITVALVLVAGGIGALIVRPEIALWQNFAVLAFFLVLGLPLFAAGKIGGGDVKLLAATGFWCGINEALDLLAAVLIAGGILALIMIGLRFIGWSEQAKTRVIILNSRAGIPYAIAIAAGGLATIILQRG